MTTTISRQRRRLAEDVVSQAKGPKLDRERGILKDVLICGLSSRNGRRYRREALEQACGLYEGCKVNLDHPEDENPRYRSYASRFGKITNVRMTPEGLRGDLVFNPSHPMAESFCWWCHNDPSAIGLSHNATGEGYDEPDGTFVVEKIVEVFSVDLVADPATTKGLFESETHAPRRRARQSLCEGMRCHPKWQAQQRREQLVSEGIALAVRQKIPVSAATLREAVREGGEHRMLRLLRIRREVTEDLQRMGLPREAISSALVTRLTSIPLQEARLLARKTVARYKGR